MIALAGNICVTGLFILFFCQTACSKRSLNLSTAHQYPIKVDAQGSSDGERYIILVDQPGSGRPGRTRVEQPLQDKTTLVASTCPEKQEHTSLLPLMPGSASVKPSRGRRRTGSRRFRQCINSCASINGSNDSQAAADWPKRRDHRLSLSV